MKKTLVRRVERNTIGRDFIVGDIHGCFFKLAQHLFDIGFDPNAGDRLFSVGDLVDRGPESEKSLEWLSRPWFFAVQGNHEDMAIRWPNGNMPRDNYVANGGWWNAFKLPFESVQYADEFSDLPIAIELETSRGLIGIVHADCPLDSWTEFVAALGTDVLPNRQRKALVEGAQWSRTRISNADAGEKTGIVQGIRAVVVGHTPVPVPTWVGNVLHIDTGGWMQHGHGFTVVDAETLTNCQYVTYLNPHGGGPV